MPSGTWIITFLALALGQILARDSGPHQEPTEVHVGQAPMQTSPSMTQHTSTAYFVLEVVMLAPMSSNWLISTMHSMEYLIS